MTLRSVITVRDEWRPTRVAESTVRALAAAASLPVETLDATETGGDRAKSTVLVDPEGIGRNVAGREGTLLVLDALGGGFAGDSLRDDVVEHVLQHVPRPVLVVGPHAEPLVLPLTLLVPVDGSGLAGAAEPVVASWASTFSGTTALIAALEVAGTWPDGYGTERNDAADRLASAIAASGCPANVERVVGEPAESLLTLAGQHRALAVVPAPQWPGLSHWYSTLRRLILNASSPVLAVPADSTDDGSATAERDRVLKEEGRGRNLVGW